MDLKLIQLRAGIAGAILMLALACFGKACQIATATDAPAPTNQRSNP